MSQPRRIIPGRTYAVTRRCYEQRFFLAPSRLLNRLIEFLLAYYATRNGIQLHGWVFMSNHWHAVLTDPLGRLPFFMGEFGSMLSRVVNRSRGRSDRLWEAVPYTAELLATQEDVLAKLAYIAANPVAAAIVRDPSQYEGLVSLPSDLGSREVGLRRAGIFRADRESSLPSSATLTLVRPPGFDSDEEFQAEFEANLQQHLHTLWSRIKRFRGNRANTRVDAFFRPIGSQPKPPTFELRPTLSNSTPEQKAELKAWRAAYRNALIAWQAGNRKFPFPPGTFRMLHVHKANVQEHVP